MQESSDQAQNRELERHKENNLPEISSSIHILKFSVNILLTISL